jgi:hypothetical protein
VKTFLIHTTFEAFSTLQLHHGSSSTLFMEGISGAAKAVKEVRHELIF